MLDNSLIYRTPLVNGSVVGTVSDFSVLTTELQTDRIHTVTLIRFGIPESFASENMTQMRLTCGTQYFNSSSVTVAKLADGILDARPEARPSAATVKLHR